MTELKKITFVLSVFSSILLLATLSEASSHTTNPCTINSPGTYYVDSPSDIRNDAWKCGKRNIGHPDANIIFVNESIIIEVNGSITFNSITYDKADLKGFDLLYFKPIIVPRGAGYLYYGPTNVNIDSIDLEGTDNIQCKGSGTDGGRIQIDKVSEGVDIGVIRIDGGDGGNCPPDCAAASSCYYLTDGLGGEGGDLTIYSDTQFSNSKLIKIGRIEASAGDTLSRLSSRAGDIRFVASTYTDVEIGDVVANAGDTSRGIHQGQGGRVSISNARYFKADNIFLNASVSGFSRGSDLNIDTRDGYNISGMVWTNMFDALGTRGPGFVGCIYQADPVYQAGDYNSPVMPTWGSSDIGCGILGSSDFGGDGYTCGDGTVAKGTECVPAEQQTTLDFHGRAIFKGAGPVYGGTAEFWISNEASDTIWGTSAAPAVTMNFDGGLFNKLLGNTVEGDPQLDLVLGDDYILFVRVCEAVVGCEQFELPFEA